MRLPEFGVKHPTAVTMLFLGIFVLGVMCLVRLPIDLMPEIEPPAISVITIYPGAGATDVETKVTKYIEDNLSIVNNLDEIRSKSKENLSIVTCKFDWGVDLNEASNDIRDKLEFAKTYLPDDIEKPMVFKFNTAMMPVLMCGVKAKESYSDLYHIVDKKVVDPLKTVPGVGSVKIMGGLRRQINVYFDRDKLEAVHIPIQKVTEILARENLTLPAGSLKLGKSEYIIRVPGEFENVDEINDVVIGTHEGTLVYLKDVAKVEDGFKEQTMLTRTNGEYGLLLMVQKMTGGNTVNIAEAVKEKLNRIEKTLPSDIQIIPIIDSSEMILWTIDNLKNAVIWGGIFVIIVTLFFLRQVRTCFIIALTIPFSLIVAFIFLYSCGYTINVMSLVSLAIAAGMVVDNAIVVLDNIVRRRDMGEKIKEASVFGPSEVGLAMAAATFTTIVIFIPLMFLKGIVGIMFKQLAFTITITLLASLFIALIFTPMLSFKLLGMRFSDKKRKRNNRFYELSERWFKNVETKYKRLLGWALDHRKKALIILVATFILSLLLVPLIGTEFIPNLDSGDFGIVIDLPVGTKVEETDRVAKEIEAIFKKDVPEMINIVTFSGRSEEGYAETMGFREGSNISEIHSKLLRQTQRKRSSEDIADVIREKVSHIPGITKVDTRTGAVISDILFAGAKPISVEIIGHDIEGTNRLAAQIEEIIKNTPGTVDVMVSREAGRPELRVNIDRKRAAALGLNVAQITDTLRTHFYGNEATKFREDDDEYDIFVRLREEDRRSIPDIENIATISFTGQPIKLKNVAEIVEQIEPLEIERKGQERIVKVGARVYGRALGKVVDDIKKGLKGLEIPKGVSVTFGGEVKEQGKAFRELIMLLILGIFLVYMVMASQFESLIDPFVIMFCVPFAFVGVILAFVVTGTTLSIVSFIGVIMLMGIVVNNGIILVDYTNILRARGMELFEAIKTAGHNRLRPVLMTTITTIFGMLPLAFSRGEGHEIWRPMGIAVIGGLLVSTLITLIIVPIVYSLFEQHVKNNDVLKKVLK
ncbi:MAG: efflux RND transporter permease subunit [Candidatus Omnitrophica bacterium]|nr:efflux RND transporter permease subunit [Candidatus Omnitrophota bacterium]